MKSWSFYIIVYFLEMVMISLCTNSELHLTPLYTPDRVLVIFHGQDQLVLSNSIRLTITLSLETV